MIESLLQLSYNTVEREQPDIHDPSTHISDRSPLAVL